jgi:hypothetical protein
VIDLHLSPSQLPQLEAFLPESSNLTLFIPSLQDLVDQSAGPSTLTSGWGLSSLSSTFHDAYHSVEEMDVFGDELAAKFGPLGIQVEKFSVGQTWEGREIRGWKAKMTDGKGDDKVGEREFVVQSGQHAREVGSLKFQAVLGARLTR